MNHTMLRLSLFALLVCLLAPAPGWALPTKTWLVAVGQNEGDADEQSLSYAERDARELTEVMRLLGSVSPRRTRLSLGESAETMRQLMLDANAEIRSGAAKDEQSVLLVYYSGHADATDLHLGGSHLPVEELRTIIEGSAADIRLLVVEIPVTSASQLANGRVQINNDVRRSDPFISGLIRKLQDEVRTERATRRWQLPIRENRWQIARAEAPPPLGEPVVDFDSPGGEDWPLLRDRDTDN